MKTIEGWCLSGNKHGKRAREIQIKTSLDTLEKTRISLGMQRELIRSCWFIKHVVAEGTRRYHYER